MRHSSSSRAMTQLGVTRRTALFHTVTVQNPPNWVRYRRVTNRRRSLGGRTHAERYESSSGTASTVRHGTSGRHRRSARAGQHALRGRRDRERSRKPAPKAAAPKPGGEITYGLEAESGGGFCLPDARLAISGIEVVAAVYDTLVVPNTKDVMVPYLAKSVSHDAAYTTWTIVLRDGIKFHDGSPLDATVVVNNIDTVDQGRADRRRVHQHRVGHRDQPHHGHRHHQGAVGRVRRRPVRERSARHHRAGPARQPRLRARR